LQNGHLKAGVLDVWENEPNIDIELMQQLDITTPHIAGYSADGKANGTKLAVKAINSFFRLGLENWKPQSIPSPQNDTINIDCKGLSHQEILCRAIEATYKVNEDNLRLKNSPKDFENQRGNYPIRREFLAYTLNLKNEDKSIVEKLKLLGFNLSANR
jgi:erythronate-4-phosphate dehydrogenase